MAESIFDDNWEPTKTEENTVSIFDDNWSPDSQPTEPSMPVRAYNGSSSIIEELNTIEQGELTERDILENETLIEGIREIMKSRYSEETRNNFSFDEKYDRDISDEELVQEWQNWMRSLAGGQTVTTGNDVAWFARADDTQRALLGASFEIMDKMPDIFDDNVTWGETLDGVRDYFKAGVWDPTTLLGLGVGRLFSKASMKTAGYGLRKSAKGVAKEALKRGMTKKQAKEAKDKVIKKGFLNAGIKQRLPEIIAGTTTDMAVAVGTDQLYQGLRIGSGVQDERSLPQSVGAALGVIVIPSIFAGTKAAKKGFEKSLGFQTYTDVMSKFGGKSAEEITQEVVSKTDMSRVGKTINKLFEDFDKNMDSYLPWTKARANANIADKALTAKEVKANSSEAEHLFESILLFGKPTEDLKQKGLMFSLAESGFVYIPRGKDDNVSNFIGDAIAALPQKTVDKMLAGAKKNLGIKRSSELGKIKTAEDLSLWFKGRSSFAGKILNNRKVAQDLLNKDINNMTLDDMVNLHKTFTKEEEAAIASTGDRVRYIQSVWKRLLTSHPSTTGLNIKGWAYTTSLNSISDVVLGAVTLPFNYKKGMGTILGAARRGYNVLDFNATADQGMKFLEFKPEVGEDLLSEISGGVETKDLLARNNLDPNSKINKASEKAVSTIQAMAGVKLQDEVTKMISFMSAMDQNIRKVYGQSFNEFMERDDAFTKMYSAEFLEKVQEPAITRAKKETYSFSWLGKKGDGVFLQVAKNVERFSNSAGGGFLIPFGRFFNTVTAMAGDYSGFNAIKHFAGTMKGARSKQDVKDVFYDEEMHELTIKALVGLGALRIAPGINGSKSELEKAEERVRNGETWNFEFLPDGSRRDYTYDAPQNYTRMVAQMWAHHRVDGEIPVKLSEQAFELFIGQTFRGTGEAYTTMKDYALAMIGEGTTMTDRGWESLDLAAAAMSRIASGGLRFLEPANEVASLITGDFVTPDRRQGNEELNRIFKYVEDIPGMIGIPDNRPERMIATRDKVNYDFGRVAGGARGDRGPSPSERLAGSVGLQAWQAMDFKGEPELRNRLDDLVQEIFNIEAAKEIENGYLELDLGSRKERFGLVKKKVKRLAKEILMSSSKKSDEIMLLEDKLLKAKKDHVKQAMKAVGYEGEITDLKNMEGGEVKMKYLLYLIDNLDLIYD
tara:strand:+ start:5733 stop:9263 length:3531 start_codon:yes stop_codon:yes gene_type:complete